MAVTRPPPPDNSRLVASRNRKIVPPAIGKKKKTQKTVQKTQPNQKLLVIAEGQSLPLFLVQCKCSISRYLI